MEKLIVLCIKWTGMVGIIHKDVINAVPIMPPQISYLQKPIGAIHFLQICDEFVLNIEFVFKIE